MTRQSYWKVNFPSITSLKIHEVVSLIWGVFRYFFDYFYSKLSIKLGQVCEKGREGHHRHEKVRKDHHGHQTIENELWQAVGVWIDPIFEPKNGHDFSVMLLTKNKLFSSSAGSDLQAISLGLTLYCIDGLTTSSLYFVTSDVQNSAWLSIVRTVFFSCFSFI